MYSPAEVARRYVETGKSKAALPVGRMLLLGMLAGAFIALAGGSATFAVSYGGRLAGAAVFPAGLAMVLLAGSELFTGNCLLVIPLLERQLTWGRMLRSWGVVYLANVLGAGSVAALTVAAGTFDGVYESVVATAAAKAGLPFLTALLRGVLCNFLVCIAVWMSLAAQSVPGKLAAMYLPIFTFVLCGFEHSVANMFYLPAGILAAGRYGVGGGGAELGLHVDGKSAAGDAGEHFGRLSGGRDLLGGVSAKGAASMSILEDIRAFVPGCEQEQRDREAMLEFLAVHEDAFLRTNLTAHMTASAWVLSRDRRRVVMVYHNLYRSWSWTGGHADGDRDLLAVAMREVTEETGLRRLAPVTEGIFSLECLTVDGHEKRGEYVPSHIHMNVTYLLAAEDDALREKPDENSGVAWFTPEEALAASTEPWMVQRVYRKLADRAAAYMKT